MKKSFVEHAQDIYAEKSLSEDQFERLSSLMGNKPEKKSRRVSLWAVSSIAAVFICALFFSDVFQFSKVTPQSVAAEVVYNHVKNLDVEVVGHTVNDVRKGLDRLDFSLVSSSFLKQLDFKMLGGRYCSINGKLAAQMKLAKGDDTYTFYQVPMPESLKLKRSPITLHEKGYAVMMWEERGLLMVIAGSNL